MGTLHLMGGEKGGVGKSFTSRLLAQYFIDHDSTLIGFDTDASHNTFSRFYAQFTSVIKLDDYSGLDQIIDAAEDNPQADIIVDLAAQTTQTIQQWIEDSDLYGILQELGYQLYLWHVMDDGADSMHLLSRLMQDIAGKPHTLVVVQNYGRGKSFTQFEHSTIYQQAKALDARSILLPNLEYSLSQKLDFDSLSFWAAVNNKDAKKVVERHRAGVWLKFCYQQLDRILKPSAPPGAMPGERTVAA